jgi:hypothetical protein
MTQHLEKKVTLEIGVATIEIDLVNADKLDKP